MHDSRPRLRFIALISTFALICSFNALADGRIEINQTTVEAAGGFPYIISEPGSYVLTGSLSVPADTNGLIIDANEVNVDLNGFSIRGPFDCRSGNCPAGTGFGVSPDDFLTDSLSSSIRNGIVAGFSGTCVELSQEAQVTDVLVSDCGLIGIHTGAGVVTRNRVKDTGEQGILMAPTTSFALNHIRTAGLGGRGERAVEGGRATAGNSCDDFSCSPRGERRFYYTQTGHEGNDALNACAAGFHMAALWELLDTSNLFYDSELGFTRADSGSGPPNAAFGWVRTGSNANTGGGTGEQNCNLWTSNSGVEGGTAVRLNDSFGDSNTTVSSPWEATPLACSAGLPVWCVED